LEIARASSAASATADGRSVSRYTRETRGRDRVAKAHAARATLAAELRRDTGAGELAGRLG